MSKGIPINAELVKLAQLRSRASACDVRQETARHIVNEAVMSLDPELDLLIDEDKAYSADDRLLSTFELNDIVINGLRFDIRVLQDDGRISLPRYLANTSYMSAGTLAVAFHPDRSASVVGFVPRSDWELQDKHAGEKEDRLIFRVNQHFDLASDLAQIVAKTSPPAQARKHAHITSSEIAQFCGHRQELKLNKQREFVDAVLLNESLWSELQSGISKTFVRKTLSHASVWNAKVEAMSEVVSGKCKRLSKDEVRSLIAKLGEKLGGQTDSAKFRREVLIVLTKEELARSLKGAELAKASAVIEQVFSGRSVLDSLKDAVKSKTAMDLAVTIKRQRQKVVNFLEASSDEIAMAFRQMALQPVYATHSQSDEGLDSVNEALNLLDAAELAESLSALESESN